MDYFKSLSSILSASRVEFLAGWRILISYIFKTRNYTTDAANEADNYISIVYSFEILSKLLSAITIFPAAAIVNIQPGRCASQLAAIFLYVVCVLYVAIGFVASIYLYSPVLDRCRPELAEGAADFLAFFAVILQFSYVTYGPFCMTYLFWHRKFFSDFVLYECARLTNSKLFQYKSTLYLFITTCIGSFFGAPLAVIILLQEEVVESRFPPYFQGWIFLACKLAIQLILGSAATLTGITYMLMPIFACMLSQEMEKHLEIEFKKQTRRLVNVNHNKQKPNDRLLELLNCMSFNDIMTDYAVETLSCDWPHIDETSEVQSVKLADSERCVGYEGIATGKQSKVSNCLFKRDRKRLTFGCDGDQSITIY